MENREVINKRMLNNIPNKYDKSEGSFHSDITKTSSIEFENVNKKIEYVKSKISIENLKGNELAQRIYEITGIKRKPAINSFTTVSIKANEGASINKGDLVSTENVNFIIQSNTIIGENGLVDLKVICEKEGNVGNVPSESIKFFPITLSGTNEVTNLSPAIGGYEAETDAQLLNRYYERLRTPATSGNKYHYINWAKEVVGVGDCKVFPLWNGNNSVKIIIVDSNKLEVGKDLVEKTQNYIDPGIKGLGEGKAPIGAFCTVESASSKVINISFSFVGDIVDNDTLIENVKKDIRKYINDIAFKVDKAGNPVKVSFNKIGSIILDCESIEDYSNLTLNGSTCNINMMDNEIPSVGVVTIV